MKRRSDIRAPNTLRATAADWRYFAAWHKIARKRKPSLPVSVAAVVQFIEDHRRGLDPDIDQQMVDAGVKRRVGRIKADTIRRRIVGINFFHVANDKRSPTKSDKVRRALFAFKREQAVAGVGVVRSAPIVKRVLNQFLSTIDRRTAQGKRDSAILVFGFYFGGRRRSEIASARRELLIETGWKTFVYTVPVSKTDQRGRGLRVEVTKKNLSPLRQWIKLIPGRGPLFPLFEKDGTIGDRPIYPEIINRIVKTCADACGYDAAQYSAHGLRRGFVTECGMQNIGIEQVISMTGHRDLKTALIYYDHGKLSRNRAGNL